MARLRKPAPDLWLTWGVLLWRSLTPCCAVMIIVGLSALAVRQPDENLGEQLHAVLIASIDASEPTP
jgi:hypothetical protein